MAPYKEIIQLGQIEIRFLLDGDDTNGQLSMFEFLVPPGARVTAPHYHEQVDEIVYGLEGVLTFTVDGRSNEIGPGDRCFVPRGIVHHFANTGMATARTLAVLTPARIGPAYFRELAALLADGPPDPVRDIQPVAEFAVAVTQCRVSGRVRDCAAHEYLHNLGRRHAHCQPIS